MKTQLRNQVAAAALLLPASFLLAASAAAAPPVVVLRAHGPEMHSLQVASNDGFRPGALLTFTVEGTPNAQGTVRIGGTGIGVGLTETFRGIYTGYYTVRYGDRLDGTNPIRATLTAGGETVAGNYLFPDRFDSRFARLDPLPRMVVPVERAPTVVMGAAPASLPLQIFSHSNNGPVDGSLTHVEGRTAPDALVNVRVSAVPPFVQPGRTMVAMPVLTETVRADSEGRFSFNFGPPRPFVEPGTRYDLSVVATRPDLPSTETRLVLFQRG
ncbi:MAG: hypothetical protein HYX47_09960 [Burkholderiales bacterium]|nr:hypothetical protein [Burkholderiales bacterium]